MLLTQRSYVVIDTETTGFSANYHRVIEVGALLIQNNVVIDRFEALIKSVPYIPYYITNFTGITTQDLRERGQRPEEVFINLRKFIGESVFVAHNVYFDFRFLNSEFSRYSLPFMNNLRICTHRTAKRAMPFLPNHRLQTIKNYFGMELPSHRALADAEVSWRILEKYAQHATVYDS